ncbi:MAG: hypothetical protein IJA90_01590 [Peptococcaceae bacterium]|nr:hypothetical protein [Peptococcaceae bacterium]
MKKFATVALSVGLIGAMVAGGSLAYLTSEDNDVNVMALGDVEIAQLEFERGMNADGTYQTETTSRGTGYKLVEFTQNKPLYPAVGEVTGWDSTRVFYEQFGEGHELGAMDVLAGLNNVQDKFVFVENTGKSDAYVRTYIAFEAGSVTEEEFDKLISTNAHSFWDYNDVGIVEINGNNYSVMECVYSGANGENGRHPDGIVHPGDYTYNNLAQVYMSSNATSEDVANLDGNGNGQYDILVLSQAVQVAGFEDKGAAVALETAFPKGESNANVAEWFKDIVIPVYSSNVDSLPEDGKIILSDNVNAGGYTVGADKNVELELAGNTFTGTVANDGGSVTIANGNIEQAGDNVLYNEGNAEVTNVTANMTGSTGYITNSRTEDSVTVFEDVDFTSTGGGVNVWQGEAIFKSGKVVTNSTSTSARHVFYIADGGKLTIEDGEFTFNPTNLTRKGSYICAQQNATVIVNGGTFHKPSTRTAPIQALEGATVTIYGGKFAFDPSAFVADGYTAVQGADGYWTVSAE